MRTNPISFAVMAGVIAISTPLLAAATPGQPAPTFTASDAAGRTINLADYRGKTVVLEWHNPQCPFVKKFYGGGDMQQLQADARRGGAVWLTINSGAPGKQGAMSADEALAAAKASGAKGTAYIPDPDGRIGRFYGARTTPHMFVIDGAGTLVYAGGIDDTPTADPADIKAAKNYVAAALADLQAGRDVSISSSKPYGCSVKY
jgi:hypothetical protein